MPIENQVLCGYNRGIISPLALARLDLQGNRIRFGAERMVNFVPRTLGPMSLRPGLEFTGTSRDNQPAIHIDFIKSVDDTAIIELTDSIMRVKVGEQPIARPAVSTAVTNGTFVSSLSGWNDADEPGASSDWVAGSRLQLTGTRYAAAVRTQSVTVSSADRGTEHGLRVIIDRGPVIFRLGTTAGNDDLISEKTLPTGEYSFSFTPTTDFHIWLASRSDGQALVKRVTIEAAGEMTISSPWGEEDLPFIRWSQSGDVIFVACEGTPPQRISRYAARSWAITEYFPVDGPFRNPNTTTTRLTPSALYGNITLNASAPVFKPGMEGALFSLTSLGQTVRAEITGDEEWSEPIRVSGISGNRSFTVTRSGTWTGTVRLQRSYGEPGNWVNSGSTYTTNGSTTENDGQDNSIIYYRVGMDSTGHGTGTAIVQLDYDGGGITGKVRIRTITSPTQAAAEVVSALGAIEPTEIWSEGEWSDYRGWPSAAALYEGRLWWAGKDKIWGSVSDAFDSFDDETEGDSAPISRSIGAGPVDRVNWLLPLLRLIVGTQLAERSARSTSLDEPLTATNFNLKAPSTRGSSPVPPIIIDTAGFFVRSDRLFRLDYQGDAAIDYTSEDMTVIAPEVGQGGFKRIAVQRYPDTRIHCLRNDGKAALFVYDRAEDVQCWILLETDGFIEDVLTFPAKPDEAEDKVYYFVRRTINGETKRYLERFALESECIGGTLNKQADSFVTYSGNPTSVMTGLQHLEGKTVVAWGDGKFLGDDFIVGGGFISLAENYSNIVAGLPYTAQFKSTKLAYAAGAGSALTQKKRVSAVGFVLKDTHIRGLKFGQDFEIMDDLPREEKGEILDDDYIHLTYDNQSVEFPGDFDTDTRLCLQAQAPLPCTVLAAVLTIKTSDRV